MKHLSGQDAWTRITPLLSIPGWADRSSTQFAKWKQDCLRTIRQIEGEQSHSLREFEEIDFEGDKIPASLSTEDHKRIFLNGTTKARGILESLNEEVTRQMHEEGQSNSGQAHALSSAVLTENKKVFVVHGHDTGLKVEVARLLEQLKLKPIVLHEQADESQTIVEKFERHSNVSFAIALLTPDDVGRSIKTGSPENPRARQNVLLELGYFHGKLGRSRVLALYSKGVELPSDYLGVLYTEVDPSGAWKWKVVQELNAAGFPVDANSLLHTA